jgi:serine/threonine protein kinase
MAKFFAEPTGKLKNYNACDAMVNEYNNLEKAASLINVGKPLAINRDFKYILVTEYVNGKSLGWYLKHEEKLYEKLTSVAQMLKTLHTSTRNHYNKENEFKNCHEVQNHLHLDSSTRETFNRLLGEWWYSPLLDRKYGCMIHRDVTPANYIFQKGIPYVIDFESSWHQANPVRDLGILCAELKNYYELNKGGGSKAEPYIGHFFGSIVGVRGNLERLRRFYLFIWASASSALRGCTGLNTGII